MKVTLVMIVAVAGLLLTFAAAGQQAKTSDQLLADGIHKQDAEGELEGAIVVLKQALAQPGLSQSQAAQAQYRIGFAYQSLGNNSEARKAFDEVGRRYPEQTQFVVLAKSHLAALGATQALSSVTDRVVCSSRANSSADRESPPCFRRSTSMSLDGRFMTTYSKGTLPRGGDPKPARMGLQDMQTGNISWLVERNMPAIGEAAISRDFGQVAYVETTNGSVDELWVIPKMQGGEARSVFRTEDEIWPAAWTPDGKSILLMLSGRPALAAGGRGVAGARGGTAPLKPQENENWTLALVSTIDGSVNRLKTDPRLKPESFSIPDNVAMERPSLSPDGRYIAYSALASAPSTARGASPDPQSRHIYVIPADGSGPEIEIVKRNGVNTTPVWSPDGSQIFFLSNFDGDFDLWGVGVRDGKLAGQPKAVWRRMGHSIPIGLASSGTLYYLSDLSAGRRVSIAEMDAFGAKIKGPVLQIAEEMKGFGQSWSPDGRYLAFRRSRLGESGTDVIVRSIETGEERTYSHAGLLDGPDLWLHDSSGFIEAAREANRATVFYRVDLKTKEFTAVSSIPNQVSTRRALSPDDKTVYAVADGPGFGLVAIDLRTGSQKTLITPVRADNIALSPDGGRVAIWNPASQIGVLTLADGSYKEVYSGPPRRGTSPLDWTRDGRGILFAQGQPWRLMVVPIDGGEPTFTGLETGSGQFIIRLNPSGSRLAFTHDQEGGTELHALDLSSLLKK